MVVSRPILESKGMRAIFRKRAKKSKILKIFWKRAAKLRNREDKRTTKEERQRQSYGNYEKLKQAEIAK